MADRRRVAGEDTETESEEEEGTVTEDQEQEQEGQLSTNHQKPSEVCLIPLFLVSLICLRVVLIMDCDYCQVDIA